MRNKALYLKRGLRLAIWMTATCTSLAATAAHSAISTSVEARGEDAVSFTVDVGELRTAPTTGAGRTWIEVAVEGFGVTSEPGLPSLPLRTFTVAVPPNRRPEVDVQFLDVERHGLVVAPAPKNILETDRDGQSWPAVEFAVDETYYAEGGRHPLERYLVSPVRMLRQQRVIDITVYPAVYDAGARALELARQIKVDVTFVPVAAARGAGRAAAPGFERGFEAVYRGVLVNYESSRQWRVGPALGRPTGNQAGFQNDAWKVWVRETGLVGVPFSELTGFPTGIATGEVGVYERSFVDSTVADPFPATPVQSDLQDVNQNGVFDSGDVLVFWGQNHRDRFGDAPYLNRYTDDNVYWITWETGAGTQAPRRSGWWDHAAPATPASFNQVVHVERDLYNHDYVEHFATRPGTRQYTDLEAINPWFMVRPFPFVDGQGSGGSLTCIDADPYCRPEKINNRCWCYRFYIPFDVWGVDPSQPVTVRARHAALNPANAYLMSYWLKNGAGDSLVVADRWSFSGQLAIGNFESDLLPGTALTEGTNEFVYFGERDLGTGIHPRAGASFDWFEVEYGRRYEAHNNLLAFDSGAATGDLQFVVTNFTNDAIGVYSLTGAGLEELTDVRIEPDGSRFQVRFEDQVGTTPAQYVAVAGNAWGAPRRIAADQPSNLATPAVEPDYIMIVHDDLADRVERLKAYREGQGHRVELARISDVYDEFDGGVERAFAIRNYLRHAFRSWQRPPLYLLLVGDHSQDYKDNIETGLSLVPSQMFFGPVRGDQGLEIIATDAWYVSGLSDGEEDFDLLLDMQVGRLPAQTGNELDVIIDKIIAYENFSADDSWRAKTLTFSDDRWSSTINFSAPYSERPQEQVFKSVSDSANAMVHRELGDLVDARSFWLEDYTGQIPDEDRNPGSAEAHLDTTGTPLLFQLISEGNLLMNYQGHANRFLLTHEWIFYPERDRDHERWDNIGRPSIWALFACHPNHLGHPLERVADVVGGRERSHGELLMAKENSGTIAVFASTGFEWLPSATAGAFRNDLNTPLWQAFFEQPPVASGTPDGDTHPRWILGEVTRLAKALYHQQTSSQSKGPIFSYVLFGDPALRIDALPPRFTVTAADSTRADGDLLEIFTPASDTVAVEVEIVDEIHIESVEVFERDLDGNEQLLPAGLVRIDSLGTAARRTARLLVSFETILRPDNYDLVVRARDANARTLERTLAVRTDVRLKADDVPLRDNDFVADGSLITATIHSPVPITEADIEPGIKLVGVQSLRPLGQVTVTPLDALGKDWEVTGTFTSMAGIEGIAVNISKGGTPGLQFVLPLSQNASGRFELERVAAFPNPFQARTTVNYQLTRPAEEVKIRILTVSGRLVREFSGTRNAGYSQVPWDGRDVDGDQVANGVYIYRVVAKSGSETRDFTGKIIRARD